MGREYKDNLEFDIEKMAVKVWNDEGEEVWIPGKAEVCDTCNGRGHHVNPAIDGNGITASEMDELGDEFFESYIHGAYDVPCHECEGTRVIVVPDLHRCSDDQSRWWETSMKDLVECNAIDAAEARAFGY